LRLLVYLGFAVPAALLGGAAGTPATQLGEQADSMQVKIVVPRTVAAGAPVPIAIHIRNTADRPVELHLQGRTVTFDLTVRRGDAVVWRRLEGAAVPAILQIRMLAPGEVLELKDTWRQVDSAGAAAGPGDYGVSGTVPTDGAPLRAGPAPLTITP
jgi:hypothetical protein